MIETISFIVIVVALLYIYIKNPPDYSLPQTTQPVTLPVKKPQLSMSRPYKSSLKAPPLYEPLPIEKPTRATNLIQNLPKRSNLLLYQIIIGKPKSLE